MRRTQLAATAALAMVFAGCSEDDAYDGSYYYDRTDTVIVHARKEYYFHPGTSIRSSEKGYAITDICDGEARNDTVAVIEGFDNIYQEGTEYTILADLSSPRALMPDLFGYEYKFVKVLEERKVATQP